jgi:hypothetical protein
MNDSTAASNCTPKLCRCASSIPAARSSPRHRASFTTLFGFDLRAVLFGGAIERVLNLLAMS